MVLVVPTIASRKAPAENGALVVVKAEQGELVQVPDPVTDIAPVVVTPDTS